jgi:hypothetical protein
MKRLLAACIAAFALASASCWPALAQSANNLATGGSDAVYTRSAPMTVGTPVPPVFGTPPFAVPVRAIMIVCTVAGNMTIQLQDGSTLTLTALPAGIYILPMQAIEVTASTATAQFWVLG